jgi:hypothetical protein
MKILTKKSLAICTVVLLSTIVQSVSAAPQYTKRRKYTPWSQAGRLTPMLLSW